MSTLFTAMIELTAIEAGAGEGTEAEKETRITGVPTTYMKPIKLLPNLSSLSNTAV